MISTRVLLIERTQAQKTATAALLEKSFEVRFAQSGKEAIDAAKVFMPHLVVLDAVSLRTPGERICQLLREHLPTTPIIHLHPGVASKVVSAADAVLVFPFGNRKLTNTIDRLLHPPPPAISSNVISCGPFTVDMGRRVLLLREQEISLTPKEAQLFSIFLQNPGATLARKTLMEQVWETNYLGDTRTLTVHIRWIRDKIEPNPSKPTYLKTVRTVGYRFDVPVSEVPQLVAASLESV
jgi:DNA-binding response OmpR family regulator